MDQSPGSAAIERVVLRPRRRGPIALACLSLVLASGGLLLVRDGRADGWGVVAFFGACALVTVAPLFAACASLEIGPDAFVVRNDFRRTRRVWSSVGPFAVGVVGTRTYVVYDRLDRGPPSLLARVNTKVFGASDALPELYGEDPFALAARMNAARASAIEATRERAWPPDFR